MLVDHLYSNHMPECKYCKKRSGVCKHGKGKTKIQRYRCNFCNKTFQIKYIYEAYSSEK